MSGILGGGTHASQPPVAIGALNIQQSSYGVPVPLVYGTNRTTGNLVWYSDFNSVQVSTGGGGGGKGGALGGGGGKGGGSSQFQYYATMAVGICEGQINGIGTVWVSKQISNMSGQGGTLFNGALNQSPWGYITSKHPGQDDGYNKLAYAAFQNYSLGTSSETPQFSFEVYGLFPFGNGIIDASPDQVISDFLSRAAFPSSYVGSFATFASYCQAMGFFISPIVDQQKAASDWLKEWMDTLNAEFVWSNKQLTIVPYGDSTVSGNGVTFTPNLTPIYNLTDDNFIVNKDEDPVTVERPDLADAYNQQPIEYCNRANQYNIETYTAEDAGNVDMFGIRTAPTLRAHHVTDPNVAQNMASIALWHSINVDHGPTYTFRLPWNYILLDPMDLVTITDTNLGLVNKLVRIQKISEDKDGLLTVTCVDMPGDISLPALYNTQATNRTIPNYNTAPGNINPPVIFESPLALAQAALVQLNVAVSGGTNWGGCDVWMSTDGNTYSYYTQILGGSRMGFLSAALNSFTVAAGSNNIDTTNNLAVNMQESNGTFNNAASNADATNINTLCYVDGEFIAYGNDVLTGTNQYNLTYLNRGLYASTIKAHNSGSNFVRMDNSVTAIALNQSRVGQNLYFKFTSFNVWGGGVQSLANVPAYQYTVLGSALLTPLMPPTGLTVSYTAGIAILNWKPITDLRSPILYQIRKGTTFAAAQIIGYTTKTTYEVWGSDTYWVSAYYQTPLGVSVYSSGQPSIVVNTPNLAQNLIQSTDEKNSSWSGSVSGDATLVSNTIVVGGPGDILVDSDVITTPDVITYGAGSSTSVVGDILSDSDIITTADILQYGGTSIAAYGTYTIPVGHIISCASVVCANVTCNWTINGFNALTSDILKYTDVLTIQDIFNGSLNASVYAQPQIQLSQDGVNFGAWQNWVPGTYQFKAINFRINIYSLSSQVQAVLSDFNYSVDVPQSVFTGTLTTSGSGSTAVTFPGGYVYNTTPIIAPNIISASAGDIVVLTGVTTSGFSIEVLNSGSPVARSINWTSTGY